MNKSHFIDFVENPSKIREKDAGILAELAKNYPYSSLVHTLLAKALKETPQGPKSLANAALHIADRAVLKEVMENRIGEKEQAPGSDETADGPENSLPSAGALKEGAASITSSLRSFKTTEVPESPETRARVPDVFEELQENLRQLKEQRERFQAGNARVPASTSEEGFSEAPAEEPETKIKEIPVQQLPERLQEIVRSRQEQEIRDPKRREQNNLIDSFIQKSAGIARKYRSQEEVEREQHDLTDVYNFTPQDLATENLAKIMVRQGKTEKAIDIYEKLVLKYPQKKAYFASCIEKLKTPDK